LIESAWVRVPDNYLITLFIHCGSRHNCTVCTLLSNYPRSNYVLCRDLFLKQPAAQLSEAKNLLQDFDHIPRVQRLLEVIDKKDK
jgi:hypothetical protein